MDLMALVLVYFMFAYVMGRMLDCLLDNWLGKDRPDDIYKAPSGHSRDSRVDKEANLVDLSAARRKIGALKKQTLDGSLR